MDREIEDIFVDIMRVVLKLQQNQVYTYNQEFKIPNNAGFYIVIECGPPIKIMSNTCDFDFSEKPLVHEIQESVQIEPVTVSLFSKNRSARLLKDFVVTAITSLYAEQMQDKYGFKIFRIPNNYRNTSLQEGSTMLYKYSLNVNCQTWSRKIIEHQSNENNVFFEDFPLAGYSDNIGSWYNVNGRINVDISQYTSINLEKCAKIYYNKPNINLSATGDYFTKGGVNMNNHEYTELKLFSISDYSFNF